MKYSWTLRVNGERLASGSAPDEAMNASEGFRYLMQYAREGPCVLTMRHGRKTLARYTTEGKAT